MRKLLVSSFVSLDGVVESRMTWASRFFDDECREYALRKLDDFEYFLLGRKAYDALVPAWTTTVTGNAFIDRINGLKKLVASTTLDEVRWNASFIRGDVAKELATLKSQVGGHLLKYGVSQLDRTLLDNGLVDEYASGSCRPESVRANEPSPRSMRTSSIWNSSARASSEMASWSSRPPPLAVRPTRQEEATRLAWPHLVNGIGCRA
jgi:dihydrofolate reductase